MNMEIDITDFFHNAAPMDYSASCVEIGQNAGRDTWNAANEDSELFMMLDTDEKREAFRDHVKGFGAWDADEIAAWSDTELNALCMQMVAGDIRESDLEPDSGRDSWEEYYARASEGQISGRLTRGDEGRIYYILGE